MPGYFAKKRLGQNFLKTDSVIDNIITTINPSPDETIIEIGPGRGALTLPLVQSSAKTIAVEFDRDLIGYLTKLLSKYDNVELVHADFLDYEPDAEKFKLVGNLPYNISSPVIEWASRYRDKISHCFFMMQKEVAARLTSEPNSKNWSPLTVLSQVYFDIEYHFDISPNHFAPPPKVTSSLISLTPSKKYVVSNMPALEKVVRQSFHQRRKTLHNNLYPKLISDSQMVSKIYETMNFPADIRAEQISLDQFLKLTDTLIDHNLI